MSAETPRIRVVLAALAGNLAVAVTKFCASALTGSSVMLSEGVHSLVDTLNELLLLYGMTRAARPRDARHPFGHGRELYFWSFIVALLVFTLGAGVSFYVGVRHLADPTPLDRPFINYVVIALSFAFEGGSWWVALRTFRAAKGELTYFEAFRQSKDASTFTVLFEDSAALLGLLIALAGVAGAQALQMPQLDAVASLGIGAVLAVSAVLLARETKELLIGEPALPSVHESLLRIAGDDSAVRTANGVFTVQLGPNQIMVMLSVEFEDALTAPDIETCVNRIEAASRSAHPDISVLFVKPQTLETWRIRTVGLGSMIDEA